MSSINLFVNLKKNKEKFILNPMLLFLLYMPLFASIESPSPPSEKKQIEKQEEEEVVVEECEDIVYIPIDDEES